MGKHFLYNYRCNYFFPICQSVFQSADSVNEKTNYYNFFVVMLGVCVRNIVVTGTYAMVGEL